MLQSVLVLYDVKEIQRAEERILTKYLSEQPDGQYGSHAVVFYDA